MGQRLKGERKRLHYTQEYVAEAVGITPAFVGHIERGERSLSLDTLIRLCNFYHVTIDYILQETLPCDASAISEQIESLIHQRTQDEQMMMLDVLKAFARHM